MRWTPLRMLPIALALSTSVSLAAPGDLDPGFGDAGIATLSLGGDYDEIAAAALQPDGKLVVGGWTRTLSYGEDFALARYLPDGSLDSSFGQGGTVVTTFGPNNDRVAAVLVQSDGKIVAGGWYSDGSWEHFAVARYTADGSLDPTFSADGKLTINVWSGNDRVAALIELPGGKLLLAGDAASNGGLVRLLADGSLDATFGTNGKTVEGQLRAIDAALVLADGRIMAAGYTTNPTTGQMELAIARFSASGILDPYWGPYSVPLGSGYTRPRALVRQTDGKFVLAGSTSNGTNDDIALVRFQGTGTLDASFGAGGKVTTAIGTGNDNARALLLQPDGKLVAVGSTVNAGATDFALVRYNTNGSLDSTFGAGGKVTTAFGSGPDTAYAAALLGDGRILAAGSSIPVIAPTWNAHSDFALARYAPDGSLDPTFGSAGGQTTNVATEWDGANAVLVQPDGTIVVAGSASNGTSQDFAVARLLPDGTPDPTFSVDGSLVMPIKVNDDDIYGMILQADGKVVVAGDATSLPYVDSTLVRFNPDGSLDASFGSGGIVNAPLSSGTDRPFALLQQPDGKLVTAGCADNGSHLVFAVARFNIDGTPDLDFGTGGKVLTVVGSTTDRSCAYALVRQPDGRLVAAGSAGIADSTVHDDFALVRYNADGSLDPTFGTGGIVKQVTATPNETLTALTLQPDGKLVGTGSYQVSNPGSIYLAVTRYDPDGTPDESFGSAGLVVVDTPNRTTEGGDVLVQPDGRLLVAGGEWNSSGSYYSGLLLRLNADGSFDSTFGTAGAVHVDPGHGAFLGALARQPDGRIVAAGSDGDMIVVRIESGSVCGDGSVDAGEQCDDANAVSGDGCDADCTMTGCGNGIVTAGEQCDDGATVGGDGCSAACQLEPTPSPTTTRTFTVTPTPTVTRTPTITRTFTPTATRTPSNTRTATRSATATNTPAATATASATATETETPTPSATATPSETPTAAPTATAADTPTATETPLDTPTATPSATATPTATDTPTTTDTPADTATPTATPSPSSTATATASDTATATETPADTATATVTITPSPTATATASATPTAASTSTATPSPTGTPTVTATATPSATPSPTPVPTPIGPHAMLFFAWDGTASGSTQYAHHYAITGDANAQFALPMAVRISNLLVGCSAPMGTGSYSIVLRRNGTNTPLGCTVANAAAVCTDAFNVVDAAAGDRLSLRIVNGNAAAAPACRATATLSASGGNSPIDSVLTLQTDSQTPADGQFCGLNVAGSPAAATCASAGGDEVSIVMPHAGALTGLAVKLTSNVGRNRTETFTVRNLTSGVDSGLAATLMSGDQQASSTSCSGGCTFNAGDRLAVRFNATGAVQARGRSLALSYSGAGAALASRHPHVANGTIYTGYHLAGATTVPGGAAVRLDRPAQLQHLFVHSTTPATRAFAVTVCSGPTSPPSCAGLRPRCTIAPGGTSCQDTTNALTVTQGSFVEVQIEAQGDSVGSVGFAVEVANLPSP